MENWKVSPQHDMQSLREGKVGPLDVFGDAIQRWILDYAAKLAGLNEAAAGMAVMVLVAAYPETIECYLTGQDSKGASKVFFRNGMREIFPELFDVPDEALDSVCDDLRNGLYHGSMLKGTVVLIPDGAAVAYSAAERVLTINPFAFLKRVQEHFAAYVARVRAGGVNDAEVINFRRYWGIRHPAPPDVRNEGVPAPPVPLATDIVTSTAAPVDPTRFLRKLE